ncbi:hypothetical protein BKA65DRAFT_471821 [Rhexocercosporidium sp. MPI-PUGE-AT-0058]|nr:hypothetical protein BKA65DRAFT_471821 [Rhexocercosporidium sp. MPI-PUGE-AT-0058]
MKAERMFDDDDDDAEGHDQTSDRGPARSTEEGTWRLFGEGEGEATIFTSSSTRRKENMIHCLRGYKIHKVAVKTESKQNWKREAKWCLLALPSLFCRSALLLLLILVLVLRLRPSRPRLIISAVAADRSEVRGQRSESSIHHPRRMNKDKDMDKDLSASSQNSSTSWLTSQTGHTAERKMSRAEEMRAGMTCTCPL